MEKFIDWLKANGYKYKNEDIYLEACTHSSYANEHHREMDDNERLEFMGILFYKFGVRLSFFDETKNA